MPSNFLKPLDTLTGKVHERSLLQRTSVTVAAVFVAALIRISLNPMFGSDTVWITFYPAVLFGAWYGRLICGLLATLLSIMIVYFIWIHPIPSVYTSLAEWVNMATFAVVGILFSALTEASHRAIRAERNERQGRERERQFFESALASSTDGFIVLDREWRSVFVNEVAARIGRTTREKITGAILWDLFPYLKESEFYPQLKKCREQTASVQFEYYYAPYKLWTEIRAYPFGEHTAFYVLDISERKKIQFDLADAQKRLAEHAAQLERTIAERTAKLQETVAELERFSYTISHDLRAPLRTLESFSQFVMDDYGDKLDSQGRDYLERIRDAARRMDALINDVLLYSTTSRGELQIKPLNLDCLMQNIVSQYSSIKSSSPNIEIKLPLGSVLGNETMLTQTLSNLLHNAVKFVKPGEQPSIKVWSEHREGRVRIFVQDKGIGIPAKSQNKIFEIFQRAHEGTYEGTGIGLAIVKRAVERMGGSIGFVSKEGEGSTFWVELPQA